MLNQKKLEIFLVKIRKSLAKQFLEIAITQNSKRKHQKVKGKNTSKHEHKHYRHIAKTEHRNCGCLIGNGDNQTPSTMF